MENNELQARYVNAETATDPITAKTPWKDYLGDLPFHLNYYDGTLYEGVKAAAEKYEPSFIARFAVDVSQKFNKFYFDCKILSAEDETTKKFRLALTNATLQALTNAFALLGIGIPDKM